MRIHRRKLRRSGQSRENVDESSVGAVQSRENVGGSSAGAGNPGKTAAEAPQERAIPGKRRRKLSRSNASVRRHGRFGRRKLRRSGQSRENVDGSSVGAGNPGETAAEAPQERAIIARSASSGKRIPPHTQPCKGDQKSHNPQNAFGNHGHPRHHRKTHLALKPHNSFFDRPYRALYQRGT